MLGALKRIREERNNTSFPNGASREWDMVGVYKYIGVYF